MTEEKIKGLTKLGSGKTEYQLDHPDISILETFNNKHPDTIHLVTFTQPRDEFTSLCPITGQPDQAKIEIIYSPNIKMVESKSLKLYLFSFRNHGAFHEDIVNTICKTLWELLQPRYLRVFGDFSPRGGLAIKPMVEMWEENLTKDDDYDWRYDLITRLVDSWDRKNGL